MAELLGYPPVLRGFLLIIIAGFTFPMAGVFILRLNLLPLRFMLMHGVLLGGALGLGFHINPAAAALAVNLVLLLLLALSGGLFKADYGPLTLFFMTASVAAASIVVVRMNVPARDTLTLLWGSLYTTRPSDLVTAAVLGGILLAVPLFRFRSLTALFYNREVAGTLGIAPVYRQFFLMVLTALTVSAAMRLMGALLLDVLILLPVIIAELLAVRFRGVLILSSLLGGAMALTGFFLSVHWDVPVSAGAAVPAVTIFLILLILKKRRLLK